MHWGEGGHRGEHEIIAGLIFRCVPLSTAESGKPLWCQAMGVGEDFHGGSGIVIVCGPRERKSEEVEKVCYTVARNRWLFFVRASFSVKSVYR